MGTIITLDQAMSAPVAGTPKIGALGQIITSDSFRRYPPADGSGASPLYQSFTDVFRGGTPKQWLGTNGSGVGGQAAYISTSTGELQFTPKGVTSLCVDAGTPDVSLSVKLTNVGAVPSGLNQMIDVRKASAETGDCYRVALYGGSVNGFTMQLYKRLDGKGTIISTSGNAKAGAQGQTLKIVVKGSSIKVYLDDIIQWDITDESVPAGNFCGFSASSNNVGSTFDDLVIREAV